MVPSSNARINTLTAATWVNGKRSDNVSPGFAPIKAFDDRADESNACEDKKIYFGTHVVPDLSHKQIYGRSKRYWCIMLGTMRY